VYPIPTRKMEPIRRFSEVPSSAWHARRLSLNPNSVISRATLASNSQELNLLARSSGRMQLILVIGSKIIIPNETVSASSLSGSRFNRLKHEWTLARVQMHERSTGCRKTYFSSRQAYGSSWEFQTDLPSLKESEEVKLLDVTALNRNKNPANIHQWTWNSLVGRKPYSSNSFFNISYP
jgi:hypothetical protein